MFDGVYAAFYTALVNYQLHTGAMSDTIFHLVPILNGSLQWLEKEKENYNDHDNQKSRFVVVSVRVDTIYGDSTYNDLLAIKCANISAVCSICLTLAASMRLGRRQ